MTALHLTTSHFYIVWLFIIQISCDVCGYSVEAGRPLCFVSILYYLVMVLNFFLFLIHKIITKSNNLISTILKLVLFIFILYLFSFQLKNITLTFLFFSICLSQWIDFFLNVFFFILTNIRLFTFWKAEALIGRLKRRNTPSQV